jgi:hypothetical protein
MESIEFFGTRHSIKPKGEDRESTYKGISENGEQLSRERARDLVTLAERAPEGAVIFIGGASDQIRTKSTAEVYGEEIKKIVAEENKDIAVFNREDIADSQKGYSKIVEELVEKINSDQTKKVIIDFPMFLKEFSIGDGKFLNTSGKLTDFSNKLLELGGNEEGALKKWIENGNVIDGIKGPEPKAIAEEQFRGIKRLFEFAKKNIGQERPIIIGFVGHSWVLDVLAVYLANGGEITMEGFEKTGGSMIKETEIVELSLENGKEKLKYRGKEYEVG